jgi:leucyl aminopeptidase
MARSQNSYIKFQKEKKKKKKREEKLQRKFEKKDKETSGKLEDMLAYVDSFGNIVDEPPEEIKPDRKKDINKSDKKSESSSD